MDRFHDRTDGALALARELERFRGVDTVVLGLPRGGVATARVVADELDAPLDIVVARKIGLPRNKEYAIGAVTSDGEVALNLSQLYLVDAGWLEEEKQRQTLEALRRRNLFLGDRPALSLRGKTAILVDDGIATGYTVEAAIKSLRKRQPAKIVVASPVAPPDTVDRLRQLADEVVVVKTPEFFYSVGLWYEEFAQVDDAEVIELLRERVNR